MAMTTIGVTHGKNTDTRKKARSRSRRALSTWANRKAKMNIGGMCRAPMTTVFQSAT